MRICRALPVPFFDWKELYAERAQEFTETIQNTAAAGGFILQAAVDEFEEKLARYLGVKHVVGLSDCTNAMLLGLRASELEPGSEVILPGHAFIAAAQAIHFAGSVPVPVDLCEHDGLIDPDAILRAITPRTRAVMAVHVNGRLCQMDAIMKIASDHKLKVFEDAAQALGARFDGKVAGEFGAWAAFSFYPSKTLGCFGDAGALVTFDDAIAETVRAMRNHGANHAKVVGPECAVWGTNARMDNIQAAILAFKLSYYDEAVARRRSIAERYEEAFASIETLTLPPRPRSDWRYFDVYQNYELRCNSRDDLRGHLSKHGVGTIVQWGGTALHQFNNLGLEAILPRTDRYFSNSLLLPMNHLLTEAQVSYVIHCVREFFA